MSLNIKRLRKIHIKENKKTVNAYWACRQLSASLGAELDGDVAMATVAAEYANAAAMVAFRCELLNPHRNESLVDCIRRLMRSLQLPGNTEGKTVAELEAELRQCYEYYYATSSRVVPGHDGNTFEAMVKRMAETETYPLHEVAKTYLALTIEHPELS